jgi:molybdopterin converting factor small subunit
MSKVLTRPKAHKDADEVIAEFGRAIDELRAEVAALRDSLAVEVRTARLVVVDDNGAERIHTFVNDNHASLTVEWPMEATDNMASVVLEACDEGVAGLVVMICGDSVASIQGLDRLNEEQPTKRRTSGHVEVVDRDLEKSKAHSDFWQSNYRDDTTIAVDAGGVDMKVGRRVVARSVMQAPNGGDGR